ncbi:MAG: M48 family metalloprotease [Bryobacteraceae bacterium]|nr:M48 family metalloprotease [Bryobacteraceae bacterium]
MFGKRLAIVLSLAMVTAGQACAQSKKLKPGMNFYSVEQDVQLGREAAAQYEKQLPIVRNSDLQSYVERIGRRLAQSPAAGQFPYSWRVVNDRSINAFALPGGPMFIHTGLILSADNEAQVAGVLAHEMAHVALRHGTNQLSKAQLMQGIGGAAGVFLGSQGGLVGQLGQMGVGLGLQSVMLKYSRDAERNADLLGTQLMNDAGYNPVEMARFFEKLEAESGKRSGVTEFFSSHPNPGNRVAAVEKEIRTLPRRSGYQNGDPGELNRAKSIAQGLPPAPKRSAAAMQDGSAPQSPEQVRPSRNLRPWQGSLFAIHYPENWEVFASQEGEDVTFAPRGAIFQAPAGTPQIGYGAVLGHEQTRNDDLEGNTRALIDNLVKSNSGMRVSGGQRQITVQNAPALLTTLQSRSPYGQTEIDILVTVQTRAGLVYAVFIAPQNDYRNAEPVFQEMLRTLRVR